MAKTPATTTTTHASYKIEAKDRTFDLIRVTKTRVRDARGVRWSENSTETEVIAPDLTPAAVSDLVSSAAEWLSFIAENGWED